MTDLKYWLWLSTRKGLEGGRALAVLDYFLTPERAYYADREDYESLPLPPQLWKGLLDKRLEHADRILGDCDRLGLRILTFQDADYPQRLRQIADPPAVLYIKGRTFHFDEEAAIAVVGTREPSTYGERAAEKLGLELAAGGALVVSGVARGVDTCAVRGALKAGGPVVSLLAGGVDKITPKSSAYLAQDVAAVGALVSEYPPGTEALGSHYRPRNRILSGLSLGVVAVECSPSGGGTMLTVHHAQEQDRDVFAVPGAIDAPASAGTNRLIREGARLVTCGRDVLEDYAALFPDKLRAVAPLSPAVAEARLGKAEPEEGSKPEDVPAPEANGEGDRPVIARDEQTQRFTDDELSILTALGDKILSVDEIVERTQISARYVLSALTMLQVQRAVEERPGRRFCALVRLED